MYAASCWAWLLECPVIRFAPASSSWTWHTLNNELGPQGTRYPGEHCLEMESGDTGGYTLSAAGGEATPRNAGVGAALRTAVNLGGAPPADSRWRTPSARNCVT